MKTPQKIEKIALVLRPDSPELLGACKEVIAIFERFGIEACVLESSLDSRHTLDSRLVCKDSDLAKRAQALVSLGGDGTLISAVRKSLGLNLPVLGINMGRLGFLTAIKPSELEEFVPLLKRGEYALDSHHLLQGLLESAKADSKRDSALGSHSADFGDLEATADLESCSAPKSPKNHESNTATPRILEDKQAELDSSPSPSSRADEVGVAIQSNQSRGTRNLESVQGVWGGGLSACLSSGSFRSGADFTSASGESTRLAQTQCARKKADKGSLPSSSPVPLEKNLSQAELESSENAQKVESTFAKLDSSARVESMDCHADKSARNDKNNSALDCHALPSDNARNDRKADSSFAPSSRASEASAAIHNKKPDSSKQVDSKETSAIAERYPLFSKETALLFSKEATLCHEKSSDFSRNDSILDSINNACNDKNNSTLDRHEAVPTSHNDKNLDSSENVFFVLNEILITKKDISGMIKIYATINDEHFHTYRADGLIIATPTGSSAYNISAGGSLVHPQCRVILLTPVCAHSLTQRPMIVSDSFCLQFSVEEDSVIMLDGQERIDFRKGDTLLVQGSFPIQLIQHPKRSYFAVLEEKFGLGGKQV